jgi:CRP/FNR family cyclic AMP-dependent transcriptional regulator
VDNPIWSYFFSVPKAEKDLVEMLKTLPVFEGLSTNETILIERMLHQRRYAAEDIIFEENTPGAGLYIVKEGEVSIRKHIEGGADVQLAVVKARSFFGEMALLAEMPRSASACATKDSILLALGKPDLENLNDRNPKLALKIINNIAGLICKRLVKANENLEVLQNRLNGQTPIPSE